MKRVIEPINKNSDSYQSKLLAFESVFRLPIREQYGEKYRVLSVPQETVNGFQVTLYSYISNNKVIGQFEERYNRDTKTLILEKM